MCLNKQLKQHIQCWPLIGQAVGKKAGKEEVDAKKGLWHRHAVSKFVMMRSRSWVKMPIRAMNCITCEERIESCSYPANQETSDTELLSL